MRTTMCEKKFIQLVQKINLHADVSTASSCLSQWYCRTDELFTTVLKQSAITDHVVESNHFISWEEIIGRECHRYKRWIKESISIRKQGPTMNGDEGQYNLSHVFDDLLVNKRTRNTFAAGNVVAKQHSSTAVNSSSVIQ